jgi:hypothetical protein
MRTSDDKIKKLNLELISDTCDEGEYQVMLTSYGKSQIERAENMMYMLAKLQVHVLKSYIEISRNQIKTK